ncbi:MAG: hypothetical protein JXR95_05105 [Deltaproteobacteria bacterium]|nr:hypothetical protein [Deltaproteobacteria bacterium]
MNFILLFRVLTALGILLFLRQHVAVILQFLFPTLVKHTNRDVELREEYKEYVKKGYKFLGIRKEGIRLIFSRKYAVFSKEGTFMDIPVNYGKSFYFITFIKDNIFLFTRSSGSGSMDKGFYHSRKFSGDFSEIENHHNKELEKLSLGENPSEKTGMKERLEVARIWYKSFARMELWKFAILSFIITLTGILFILRILFFIKGFGVG